MQKPFRKQLKTVAINFLSSALKPCPLLEVRVLFTEGKIVKANLTALHCFIRERPSSISSNRHADIGCRAPWFPRGQISPAPQRLTMWFPGIRLWGHISDIRVDEITARGRAFNASSREGGGAIYASGSSCAVPAVCATGASRSALPPPLLPVLL